MATAHPGSSVENWPPLPQSLSLHWPLCRDYKQTLSKWSRDSPLTVKTHLLRPATPDCLALPQPSSQTCSPLLPSFRLFLFSWSIFFSSLHLISDGVTEFEPFYSKVMVLPLPSPMTLILGLGTQATALLHAACSMPLCLLPKYLCRYLTLNTISNY